MRLQTAIEDLIVEPREMGIPVHKIEGSTGEYRADVAASHLMVVMQAGGIEKPVDLWVIIIGIPESFETRGETPGEHNIIIVPGGDETPLSQGNRRVELFSIGVEPPGEIDHTDIRGITDQLLARTIIEYEQFLVRIILSQEGFNRLLEQPLVVWRSIIGGTDTTHLHGSVQQDLPSREQREEVSLASLC